MTSLAGAVEAVDAGHESLEAMRGRGRGFALVESTLNGIGAALVSPAIETPSLREATSDRRSAEATPGISIGGGTAYLFLKRTVDVCGSLLALLLFSPLFAVVAIIIKLSDGGPVFYPHIRVGKWGREFRCRKFRTMVVNADNIKAQIAHLNTHDDHRTFKVPDDPRVTRIGWWLRRTSIDEIPQLWNVFRGDMSLVGPRPPVPEEVERYDLDDMQRLMVKPGLTCTWQVSGRSRLPFPEQLEMDMAYIEQRSLWLDTKLLLKTVPAVFSADGAY